MTTSNDTNSSDYVGWPSALVAVTFLTLFAAVAVTAISRYAVDDALKVWTPLIALLGVVAGAFISYFFTRTAIQATQTRARVAEARQADAEAMLEIAMAALRQVAGRLQPEAWAAMLEDPAVARAVQPRAASR